MPKRITLKQALKCTGCHPACTCREYRSQKMPEGLLKLRKVFTPPLAFIVEEREVLRIINEALEG